MMAVVIFLSCWGSPAHAGIDLGGVIDRSKLRGFPRTRGDRPCACIAGGGTKTVPPHTRG